MRKLLIGLVLVLAAGCASKGKAVKVAPVKAVKAVKAQALAAAVAPPEETYPLRIHGHSQKQFYASRAELQWFDPQSHWEPGNAAVPLQPGEQVLTTHAVHIALRCPYMAEWLPGVTFRCDFVIKAFHLNGKVNDFFAGVLGGHGAKAIVWDYCGCSTQPEMVGDPAKLLQWSGWFTVDPDPMMPHGWVGLTGSSAVFFTNGDSIRANAVVSVYSMFDPSKPEEYGFPMVSSRPTPHSPRRPDVDFGANQLDVVDPLPLMPFSKPWTMRISPARYGNAAKLPVPTVELRADVDLHNNISGRSLFKLDDPPNPMTITLDPAVITAGPHRLVLFFTQPDGGLEKVTSLIAWDVVIGDDVPPPPPPDVWATVGTPIVVGSSTLTTQQLGQQQVFRLCVNNVCGPQQP